MESLEMMTRDYIKKKFSGIDSASTTKITIRLVSFEIEEYRHELRSNARISESSGISTGARNKVLVEIFEQNNIIYSELISSQGGVSNIESTFEESHYRSINAANESFVMKLHGRLKELK